MEAAVHRNAVKFLPDCMPGDILEAVQDSVAVLMFCATGLRQFATVA